MSPRRRTLSTAIVLALFLGIGTPDTARAADKTEVRLLTAEGKFAEADKLLDGDDALKTDKAFRAALADAALRSSDAKKGVQKLPGVLAALAHLQAAAGGEVDLGKIGTGAFETALEVVNLQIEAKDEAGAKSTVEAAGPVLDAVIVETTTDAGMLIAAADLYDKRADLSHKVEQMERIIGDLGKAAALLERAAATYRDKPKALGWAALAYSKQAEFVFDKIPIESETRDEQAIRKAVALATQACKTEGATNEVYTNHLITIRTAKKIGVTDIETETFLEDVRPAVEGLALKIPKGGIWKTRKTEEWDFHATRQFEGEGKSVEVLVKIWGHDEALYGKTLNNVKDVVEIRAEAQEGKFKEIKSKVPPHLLGDPEPEPDDGKKKKKPKKRKKKKPKKGEPEQPDVWHFRIVGEPTNTTKPQQLAEFFWSDDQKGITFQIRILDWGTPWGLEDEDVTQFIRSAVGDQWPPEKDEKKK